MGKGRRIRALEAIADDLVASTVSHRELSLVQREFHQHQLLLGKMSVEIDELRREINTLRLLNSNPVPAPTEWTSYLTETDPIQKRMADERVRGA